MGPIRQTGSLPPEVSEASGLVASRRHPGILWLHDDSDHGPLLYAVRVDGHLAHTTRFDASHFDWEDIAHVQLGTKSCLALCDIGDNNLERDEYVIHLLAEPAAGESATAPLGSIRFRYPDGPHDVEAVAADGDRLLLLSKRDHPPVLFELPLDGPTGEVRVARRLGLVDSIPPPPITTAQCTTTGKRYRFPTQPTGMDIDPTGRRLVVSTYSQVCLYERRAGESWLEAMQRRPFVLPMPASQTQAEAIGFSADGRAIYVTSEGRHAPIHRIDLTALR